MTDGKIYEQHYEKGKVMSKLEIVGETDKRGTSISFKADPEIFDEVVYDYDVLRQRLRETAFLTKGLRINLKDERIGKENFMSFCYEGGIKEFVSSL